MSNYCDGKPCNGGGTGVTRFVDLTDTPATITADQWLRGNGAGSALEFGWPGGTKPEFFDICVASGLLDSVLPSALGDRFRKKELLFDNYATYFKHAWWIIRGTLGTVWPAQKFATSSDLLTFLHTNLDHSGGQYNECAYISAYVDVNVDDRYPTVRRCRNTILASMKGRKRWLKGGHGVHNNFDNCTFYSTNGWILDSSVVVTWQNRIAANFVRQYTNDVDNPATNNNDAIWYTRGNHSQWNLPKVGTTVQLAETRAMWDRSTLNWVSVSGGSYTIGNPFILADYDINHVGHGRLYAFDASHRQQIRRTFGGNSVIVFPVTDGGNRVAFVVCPNGADAFYTDYLDDSIYELVARIRYRHEFSSDYRVIPPYSHNRTEETMFVLTNPDKLSGSYLFPNAYELSWNTMDSDHLPVAVDIARRNKTTGVRSPWVTLLKARRRTPCAHYKLDPDFKY